MRFFFSVLAVIVFIVVVIVLVAGHSTNKIAQKTINLTTYNYPGTSVSQTTTGLLVGEDQRQAIRITVSEDERDIYFLTGYEMAVSSSETYTNTPLAYSTFLGALENANFTYSRKTTQQNIFGVCPLGNTYQYQLDSPTSTVFNNWSTSCNLSDGTFAGYGSFIRQLFSLQIPNYSTFVKQATNVNNFLL